MLKKISIQLETLICPSCSSKIEAAVKGLAGVDKESVKVLFNASKVKLEYDPEKVSSEEIGRTISKLGYTVLSIR